MQRLNEDIRRLASEVNGSIDDISRMISIEYMKKKTNELKAKQNSFASLRNNMATNPPSGSAPSTMSPPIRSLSSRSGQEGKGDLYSNHPAVHSFGRIDPSEQNFETLGRASGERSLAQNYQPL